jgi:Ca2+-binding EF-hand superfamily protein
VPRCAARRNCRAVPPCTEAKSPTQPRVKGCADRRIGACFSPSPPCTRSTQKVFDEYDKDRSGKVSLDEFTKKLHERKQKAMVRPGEASSLEQRKAQEGISISDLSEGAFREMDKDGDGEVEFVELLRLMFRYATDKEVATMMDWVTPEPEPEPEPKAELSKEARNQISSIFKLYDKDKSGTLTISELRKALEKTGIDPDEIKAYFKEYDQDGNQEIDKTEFMALMESTGAFDDM